MDKQRGGTASPPSPGMADAGADGDWGSGEQRLRSDLAARVMSEIAEMPLDNFLVRPRRKLVEHYAKPENWARLTEIELNELSNEIAGLPTQLTDPELEAKLFDVLMLRLQLGRLRNDRSFPQLAQRVRGIAEALEGKAAIPMVADRLDIILEIQTDEFWQDVTVVRLESVRKQIRELVKFIDKLGQKSVYTNFEDETGDGININLPVGGGAQSFDRFKEKVRHFLRPREKELALQKLRLGLTLTRQDIEALDRMLVDANLGTEENYQSARQKGLGLFIRSLVGLDRHAALKAFEGFLRDRDLNANQQEFVGLIIEELTRTGFMDAGRLYESPFVDIAPTGAQDLFSSDRVAEINHILDGVRKKATEIANA